MQSQAETIVTQLEEISGVVREKFGGLSDEQLNWRPAPDSWSIAQCLDHLIKSDEMFYDAIDGIAAGERRNSLWEQWSPFTGLCGRFLIKALENDKQKTKTVAALTPPSEIGPGIVDRFIDHQNTVAAKVRATANADWKRNVITSPILKLLTYNLADGYQIVLSHERRHIRQAERVLQAQGFPQKEAQYA